MNWQAALREVMTSLARRALPGLKPRTCSLDIWSDLLQPDLCPEGGYRTQPRVSTLGTLKINEFALKGRKADLVKLAPIAAPKIRAGN